MIKNINNTTTINTITNTNKEESIMTNKTFEQFNQELINKGLVFDCIGEYDESQSLEAIYSWGYIVKFDCMVLPDIYKLYDNQDQLICSFSSDDVDFKIINNILIYKRTGFNGVEEFSYNLKQGAPIHTGDVKDILLYSNPDNIDDDDRIIILKDGRAFRKKDGYPLQTLDNTAVAECYLDDNYELLDEQYYASNIDLFNDLIVNIY